jgi:hypothetical protein
VSIDDKRKAAPRAARMIGFTAAAALACWGATLAMVRAVAQQAPPSPVPSTAPPPVPSTATGVPAPGSPADDAPPVVEAGAPPADDADTNEEAASDRARAPVTLDELPEFRDSADNNITLPVDI